ncbi:ABC transporter permease [Faunimonas sp. B44]|uniref:ABC transporter permease n=1 Tax=Faunimonas sp. B44 TaxID=3461493 RepID=UPI004044FB3D
MLFHRTLAVLFGVSVLLGWEAACRIGGISDLVLPAPSQIGSALVDGLRSGQLIAGLKVTLIEIVLGFLLASTAALLLGTLISQVALVEAVLYPYIVAIQTLPKIAVAPLVLVWVGFGLESKVVIAAMVSFFPILVNTIIGLKSTPEAKLELMRSLSASSWKTFWYVKLPEALPFIFAGLNVGIVMSVLGAIVGEFIGAKAGLGYMLLQMNYNLDVAGMFSVLVVLGLMGIVLNGIAQYARRKVVFWRRDNPAGGH